MPESKFCPVPIHNPERPIRHHDLMCAACWYVVPASVRKEFLDARETYRKSRSARDAPRLAAAAKAAIESVNPTPQGS